MEQTLAMKIMDECGKLLDTLPNEKLTTWNFLREVNNIVSFHEGVDCLMHINFANGGITQCMCVITDWQPGAIAFQSDEGEFPRMRLIFPEDYVSFMSDITPIFDAKYPKFPADQK